MFGHCVATGGQAGLEEVRRLHTSKATRCVVSPLLLDAEALMRKHCKDTFAAVIVAGDVALKAILQMLLVHSKATAFPARHAELQSAQQSAPQAIKGFGTASGAGKAGGPKKHK